MTATDTAQPRTIINPGESVTVVEWVGYNPKSYYTTWKVDKITASQVTITGHTHNTDKIRTERFSLIDGYGKRIGDGGSSYRGGYDIKIDERDREGLKAYSRAMFPDSWCFIKGRNLSGDELPCRKPAKRGSRHCSYHTMTESNRAHNEYLAEQKAEIDALEADLIMQGADRGTLAMFKDKLTQYWLKR